MQKAVQQSQQGHQTSWENALQRSLIWNEIGRMALLRISFLIRPVYDFLPSNANLVRWRMKDNPTYPLCQGKQTAEYVLSSYKVAEQSSYTWRQNRVLQKLAIAICDAKVLPFQPRARTLVYTLAGKTKSWCGNAAGMVTQRKS
ncbi:reverse transcriptase [Plakobranchus ocellatus]|uniref:Reverse transcriptase n=1 Tax=Plakobranchus ocellatus TaxID=259542 RepID=A0AAV3Z7P0_9GAST|nr:reverse transcriptase [Plakobranchus ocellatus]